MSALLVLAGLLAGCSDGGNADTDSTDDSTLSVSGTRSGSFQVGANATGNGSANQTGPEATWTYDNRSGSVSGNGAVVNLPLRADEDFTIPEGTAMLVLNLTSDTEVTLSVRGPGCEDDGCAQDEDTVNGAVSMTFEAPQPGDWVAQIQLEGAGPLEANYELAIAYSQMEDRS